MNRLASYSRILYSSNVPYEKTYLYPAPIRDGFLGSAVVAAARRIGEDPLAISDFTAQIDRTRQTLTSFDEDQRATIDQKLNIHMPGAAERLTILPMPDHKFDKPEGLDWVSYLSTVEVPTLTDFLEWHNRAAEFQQDSPLLQKMTDRYKRLFVKGLHQGANERWLSVDVLDQSNMVADTSVRLADYFDEAFMDGAGGMYDPMNGRLVLPQGKPTESMRKVFNHEMMHPFMNTGRGPWFEEMAVDTAAMWMSGAKKGVIDFTIGGYTNDKWIAFMLTTAGDSDIDPTLLTRLASSCSSDEWQSIGEELAYQEDMAWGHPGILSQVDDYIVTKIHSQQRGGKSPLASHRDAVEYVCNCFGRRDFNEQRTRLPAQVREVAERIIQNADLKKRNA